MDRFKQVAAGSYAISVATALEDGTTPTVTSPSVAITDGAGVAVTSGTPTYANGLLTFSVSAALLTNLDTYHCAWTGTQSAAAASWSSDFELQGNYICEIVDIRNSDRAFTDAVKYPLALLRSVRSAAQDMLHRAARVSFVPRGRRVVVDGSAPDFFRGYTPLLYGQDTRKLMLPDVAVTRLYSGTMNGVDLTVDDLSTITVDDCLLYRSAMYPPWPFGRQNISLHYVHGLTTVPGPIARAAVILCREYLVGTDLPGRATATSIGDQMFRLTIAGRDGATGLPEVDSAVDQFGRHRYGVG